MTRWFERDPTLPEVPAKVGKAGREENGFSSLPVSGEGRVGFLLRPCRYEEDPSPPSPETGREKNAAAPC
jgi:hypothetical protein